MAALEVLDGVTGERLDEAALAPADLRLVAGHLRETSPGTETVCCSGGPARLPLLTGVE
jgi:hypothetical protein